MSTQGGHSAHEGARAGRALQEAGAIAVIQGQQQGHCSWHQTGEQQEGGPKENPAQRVSHVQGKWAQR